MGFGPSPFLLCLTLRSLTGCISLWGIFEGTSDAYFPRSIFVGIVGLVVCLKSGAFVRYEQIHSCVLSLGIVACFSWVGAGLAVLGFLYISL